MMDITVYLLAYLVLGIAVAVGLRLLVDRDPRPLGLWLLAIAVWPSVFVVIWVDWVDWLVPRLVRVLWAPIAKVLSWKL